MSEKTVQFDSVFFAAGITVFVFASLFYNNSNYTKAQKARNSAMPVVQIQDEETKTAVEKPPAAASSEAPKEIPKPAVNLSSLEMPILMYHHIRDFHDPNDPIGTNLSVSPSDFSTQLDYLIQQGYQTINFSNIKNNDIPPKPIILTFDDGYRNFYENAYPELKKRNMTAVVFVIADYKSDFYLNNEQLKEINGYGIEIGSHTLTHVDLSKSSTEIANNQISRSKEEIEGLLGKKIDSFCYPSGKYDDRTIISVKDSGYQFAVTTKPGMAEFSHQFEMSRIRVNNNTNISKALK